MMLGDRDSHRDDREDISRRAPPAVLSASGDHRYDEIRHDDNKFRRDGTNKHMT